MQYGGKGDMPFVGKKQSTAYTVYHILTKKSILYDKNLTFKCKHFMDEAIIPAVYRFAIPFSAFLFYVFIYNFIYFFTLISASFSVSVYTHLVLSLIKTQNQPHKKTITKRAFLPEFTVL